MIISIFPALTGRIRTKFDNGQQLPIPPAALRGALKPEGRRVRRSSPA